MQLLTARTVHGKQCICKHVRVLTSRLKCPRPPPEARDDPMCQVRKVGRPKKAAMTQKVRLHQSLRGNLKTKTVLSFSGQNLTFYDVSFPTSLRNNGRCLDFSPGVLSNIKFHNVIAWGKI